MCASREILKMEGSLSRDLEAGRWHNLLFLGSLGQVEWEAMVSQGSESLAHSWCLIGVF